MKNSKKSMALETSARVGSVALGEGAQVLAERGFTADMQHAGELLPTMAAMVSAKGWEVKDLEHLYVSAGPGSFTGLRIGITAAKVLGWAQLTKIVAVPSTDAAVLNVDEAAGRRAAEVIYAAVVIDAKRKGVYAALYEKERENNLSNGKERSYIPGWRCVREPAVCTAEEMMALGYRPLVILGDGIAFHREKLSGEGVVHLEERYWQPRAANVLRCGWLRAEAGVFTKPEELVPCYLRRPEAVERWEIKEGIRE